MYAMKFASPNRFSESPLLSSSFGTSGTPERERPSEATTSSNLSRSSSSSSSISDHPQSFTKPDHNINVDANKNKNYSENSKNYVYRIRDHVKLGSTLPEMLKGKMSLGAEIIRKGGRENIFRHIFGIDQEKEQLLKASQCYLSTTAGPIAGILFISTHKVAFWSERPITITSTSTREQGLHVLRTPYKVIIPVKNIKRVAESKNMEKQAQKYIVLVTQDNFEFWYMGFLRYEKAFLSLHKAISIYN